MNIVAKISMYPLQSNFHGTTPPGSWRRSLTEQAAA